MQKTIKRKKIRKLLTYLENIELRNINYHENDFKKVFDYVWKYFLVAKNVLFHFNIGLLSVVQVFNLKCIL